MTSMWNADSDRDLQDERDRHNEPRTIRTTRVICRCGSEIFNHSATGMLSRQVVCEDCGRAEEREALRRRGEGSQRQAS